MRKYSDYTVDEWQRIAVVDWANDLLDSRHGAEINESDLPEGFEKWTTYDRFADGDCVVNVVSEGGA
jgi:hypothetical protein